MKLLLWIVIGLAAVVVLVAIIGSRLPKAHHAARSARFPVPPETLYAVLADVERFPEWRKDVKRVERLPDRDGRPAWIEHGSHGAVPMFTERAEPPSLMIGRIGEGLAFGGTWTFRIAPAPGGSELTIAEDGEIYNPDLPLPLTLRVRVRSDNGRVPGRTPGPVRSGRVSRDLLERGSSLARGAPSPRAISPLA